MSLSDCSKCWDTPCSCGWDYRNYTKESLAKHLAAITSYRSMIDRYEILTLAINELAKIQEGELRQMGVHSYSDLTEEARKTFAQNDVSPKQISPDRTWDYEHNHPKQFILSLSDSKDQFPGKNFKYILTHIPFELKQDCVLVNTHNHEFKLKVRGKDVSGSYWCEFINNEPQAWMPRELFEYDWIVMYPE